MHIVDGLRFLGVGGIKLGQFMSTRYDLLPASWIRACNQFREDNKEVVISFDRSPFLAVDPKPIAVASIGQVYKGVLRTGETVAIKLKKPGVDRQIKCLIASIKVSLWLPSLVFKRAKDLVALVNEFNDTLKDETNYLIEAANMDRMRGLSSLHVPCVFWDYTTKNQIVMEYVDGFTLGSSDHKCLALPLVHDLMNQMLVHGFFHADLHPGNLKVMPDGKLAMLDFGMVGRISGDLKEYLMLLAYGFLIDNEQIVTKSMLRLCIINQADERALMIDVRRLMDLYISTPLSKVDFQSALFELIALLRTYGIFIKPQMIYVIKALVTTEGVAVGLDGDISIYNMMKPFQQKLAQLLIKNKCQSFFIDKWFSLL